MWINQENVCVHVNQSSFISVTLFNTVTIYWEFFTTLCSLVALKTSNDICLLLFKKQSANKTHVSLLKQINYRIIRAKVKANSLCLIKFLYEIISHEWPYCRSRQIQNIHKVASFTMIMLWPLTRLEILPSSALQHSQHSQEQGSV